MRSLAMLAALAAIWCGAAMAQDFGERQVGLVCQAQYGSDREMIDRCIDSQRDSFDLVQDMRDDSIALLVPGIDRCTDEHWPDWESVRICSAVELEASFRIMRFAQEYHDQGGGDLLLGMAAQACEDGYAGRLQQFDQCIRNTLEVWYESHPLDRHGAEVGNLDATELEADAALAELAAAEAAVAAAEAAVAAEAEAERLATEDGQ